MHRGGGQGGSREHVPDIQEHVERVVFLDQKETEDTKGLLSRGSF